VDKGFVLGSTEEITLLLDDNTMSLQSMTASRFVGPFIEQVRLWEKRLSSVAEVIDVWIVVQRKWQYLEGIFLAGDIRQQLPNEARKFEGIDKAFKVRACARVSLCVCVRVCTCMCACMRACVSVCMYACL
jgi:dynein heavy chain, axonemal